MPRYIDAERIRLPEDLTDYEKARLLAAIISQPTADVAPVVYGEWVFVDADEYGGYTYECSHCGTQFKFMLQNHAPRTKHCPECGAKLTKED